MVGAHAGFAGRRRLRSPKGPSVAVGPRVPGLRSGPERYGYGYGSFGSRKCPGVVRYADRGRRCTSMPYGSIIDRLIAGFSGGFVLAFHVISPKHLADLVDCLRPAHPVPLSEVVQRSRNGKSTSGLFAITVDDGEGENVRALAQLFL